MEVTTFTCSICGESSRDICIACTKDTCANHLCERCKRCSDCCVCEVPLITQPEDRHYENHYHDNNGKVLTDAPFQEPERAADVEDPPSGLEEA